MVENATLLKGIGKNINLIEDQGVHEVDIAFLWGIIPVLKTPAISGRSTHIISNPFDEHGPVAQLAEQATLNR